MLDRRGKPMIARDVDRPRAGSACGRRGSCSRRAGRPCVTVSSVAPAGARPRRSPGARLAHDAAVARGAGSRSGCGSGSSSTSESPAGSCIASSSAALRVRDGACSKQRVANRGNVVERARVRVALFASAATCSRGSGPRRRTLLPHSRGIERFRYRGRLRGWVTARVEVGALRRSFRTPALSSDGPPRSAATRRRGGP